MRDAILSYITDAPVSYSIYSAFSFYGTRRGGALAGPWIVRALSELGHGEATIRQTLYRMEADRELTARRTGRVKRYRLTPFAEAEVIAGTEKIFAEPRAWDGRWTLVHLRFDRHERIERERVRSVLQVEGYAAIGPGLFIHPLDTATRLTEAVISHGISERILAFRGARLGGASDHEFVRQHWAIDALARRYSRFLKEFGPLESTRVTAADAFRYRFATALAFLEIAWEDPGLAKELLPRDWPGHAARRLARLLYQRLLPGALAHGDSLLSKPDSDSLSHGRRRTTARRN